MGIKVGSQCDARNCVALVCNTRNFLIKYFQFVGDQKQDPNAKEHGNRIQVYPRVAL